MIYNFFETVKSLGLYTHGGRVGQRSSSTATITDNLVADGAQTRVFDDNVDTYPNSRMADTVTTLSFQDSIAPTSGSGNQRQDWQLSSLTPGEPFSIAYAFECRRLQPDLDHCLFMIGDGADIFGLYLSSAGELYVSDKTDRSNIISTGYFVQRADRVLVNLSFDGANLKIWCNASLIMDTPFTGYNLTGDKWASVGRYLWHPNVTYSVYTDRVYTNGEQSIAFKSNIPGHTPQSGYMAIGSLFVHYTSRTPTTIDGVSWDMLGYEGYSQVKASAGSRAVQCAPLIGYNQCFAFGKGTTTQEQVDLMFLHTGWNYDKNPSSIKSRMSPDCLFTRINRDDDPISPDTPEIIDRLSRQLDPSNSFTSSGAWVNTTTFTFKVYESDLNTKVTPLKARSGDRMDGNGRLTMKLRAENCFIPNNAKVGIGTDTYADGELVVHDPDRDRIYDAYHAEIITPGDSYNAPDIEVGLAGIVGNASMSHGYYGDDGSTTRAGKNNAGGWGGAATAIRYDAGQVTVEEFLSGQINHAIAMSIPVVANGGDGSGYVFPAQSRDGDARPSLSTEQAHGIPEGTFFKLPSTYEPGPEITDYTTLLAIKVMKKYGGFVRDRASNVIGMYVEEPTEFIAENGYNPYDGLIKMTGNTKLPGFPWSELLVIDPNYLKSEGWKVNSASGTTDMTGVDTVEPIHLGNTPLLVSQTNPKKVKIEINNLGPGITYYGGTVKQCALMKSSVKPGESIILNGYSGPVFCLGDATVNIIEVVQ